MLKRGVYAAGMSILNKDLTLNVEATITHGENLIKNGCTGVFFMGSTGQAQLCSIESKKELISKITIVSGIIILLGIFYYFKN